MKTKIFPHTSWMTNGSKWDRTEVFWAVFPVDLYVWIHRMDSGLVWICIRNSPKFCCVC